MLFENPRPSGNPNQKPSIPLFVIKTTTLFIIKPKPEPQKTCTVSNTLVLTQTCSPASLKYVTGIFWPYGTYKFTVKFETFSRRPNKILRTWACLSSEIHPPERSDICYAVRYSVLVHTTGRVESGVVLCSGPEICSWFFDGFRLLAVSDG